MNGDKILPLAPEGGHRSKAILIPNDLTASKIGARPWVQAYRLPLDLEIVKPRHNHDRIDRQQRPL